MQHSSKVIQTKNPLKRTKKDNFNHNLCKDADIFEKYIAKGKYEGTVIVEKRMTEEGEVAICASGYAVEVPKGFTGDRWIYGKPITNACRIYDDQKDAAIIAALLEKRGHEVELDGSKLCWKLKKGSKCRE